MYKQCDNIFSDEDLQKVMIDKGKQIIDVTAIILLLNTIESILHNSRLNLRDKAPGLYEHLLKDYTRLRATFR